MMDYVSDMHRQMGKALRRGIETFEATSARLPGTVDPAEIEGMKDALNWYDEEISSLDAELESRETVSGSLEDVRIGLEGSMRRLGARMDEIGEALGRLGKRVADLEDGRKGGW